MIRKTVTEYVDVTVTFEPEDLGTDDLIAELEARGFQAVDPKREQTDHRPAMQRALDALEAGDRLTAIDELRNALHPHDLAAAWAAAREGKHPFLTVRPQ